MTLYLHEDMLKKTESGELAGVGEVRKAAKAGVKGA